MSARLYASDVMHQRLRPKAHRLNYAIVSVMLDLETLEEDLRPLRLFSLNRFNLFSFHEKDRGDGRPRLMDYVHEQLQRAGLFEPGLRILLLTMPRVLGWAFNPLSVYYCLRADGSLRAVLWEVDNTFGERHSYLIPAEAEQHDLITQTCEKRFYVSPFMPMALTYRFRFRVPGEALHLHITAFDEAGPLLIAAQHGRSLPLRDAGLLRLFLRLPLQALNVLAGIHWEALKIWRKGIRLVTKPPGHSGQITTMLKATTPSARGADHA